MIKDVQQNVHVCGGSECIHSDGVHGVGHKKVRPLSGAGEGAVMKIRRMPW